MARMFHCTNGRHNFETITLDNYDSLVGNSIFMVDKLPADFKRPAVELMKQMLRREESLRLSPETETAYATNVHYHGRC
jgi:hypothetical protein